jgi:hypothetical protein
MSSYNGLFLRSALGQSNDIPRSSPMSPSPDIIVTGIEPLQDPQTTLRDSYNQSISVPLKAQETNYVYLRAKNYSSDPIYDISDGSRPRLFLTRASLLMYPGNWTEITQTASHHAPSITAEAGAVAGTYDPYVLQPSNTIDPCSLIAVVPSPGYDNNIPGSIISDFAGWIAQHGGIAMYNVTILNATTVTITGAGLFYEQGTEASEIMFTLICKNLPVGCKVSLSAGVPGPSPEIYLQPTVVTTYPTFVTGIICQVPANYASDIYFNLEAPPGVTDLGNASITIQASYPTPPGSPLQAHGQSLQDMGLPSENMRGAKDSKFIVVGSHTWKWQ